MRQRPESMKFCCVCQFVLYILNLARIRMNFEQQPGRQGAFLSGGDMKRLLVTVKPFNGTIPFRVLQRGRVLVKDIFSGKCTECYSRTYEVDATDEEI